MNSFAGHQDTPRRLPRMASRTPSRKGRLVPGSVRTLCRSAWPARTAHRGRTLCARRRARTAHNSRPHCTRSAHGVRPLRPSTALLGCAHWLCAQKPCAHVAHEMCTSFARHVHPFRTRRARVSHSLRARLARDLHTRRTGRARAAHKSILSRAAPRSNNIFFCGSGLR